MATKAWERLEKESARAFAAFAVYLELGPERSLAKTGQKLGKNLTTIGEWSTKHGWVDRARSWDLEVERKAMAEEQRRQVKALAAVRSRQRKAGSAIMRALVARATREDFAEKLTPAELVQMGRLALQLEALGHSAATEPGKVATSGDLTDPLKEGQAPSNEPVVTMLRKLEIEVIGAGGQVVPASELTAENIARWYDKSGG